MDCQNASYVAKLEAENKALKEQLEKESFYARKQKALRVDTLNKHKALREVLLEVVTISDRKHDAWDKAKALLEGSNELEL